MPTPRDCILDLLAARPGLTQFALADRLGMSTRQLRRLLKPFLDDGTVVATPEGTSLRYRLADAAHPALPVPPLTEAEAEALAVAALAARSLLAPTPLLGPLDAAAAKLRQQAVRDVVLFEADTDPAYWSFDGAAGGAPPETDPTIFRGLLDAAREGRAVRADYYTASRRALGQGRRLGPLGFLVRAGAWMVACRDLDAPGAPVKDFSVAGFRAVDLTDDLVDPPDDFDLDAYARDRFGALDGSPEEVRLLVEPEAVPYFRRRAYNPTQQIEEERPDGRAVVSFEVAGLDAVRAWALSWGPKVRVLAPAALADTVAADLRAALDRYAEADDA